MCPYRQLPQVSRLQKTNTNRIIAIFQFRLVKFVVLPAFGFAFALLAPHPEVHPLQQPVCCTVYVIGPPPGRLIPWLNLSIRFFRRLNPKKLVVVFVAPQNTLKIQIEIKRKIHPINSKLTID